MNIFSCVKAYEAYEATTFNHSYSFQSPHHKLVYSQEVAPEI